MIDAALLDAPAPALSPKCRAMLAYLKKSTLLPEEVDEDDREALRTAGVSDAAVMDALNVAYAFNVITRMADVLNFKQQTAAELANSVKSLLSRGYR